MSLFAKLGVNWHPLARLNLFILIFFVLFQSSAALSLLVFPAAIDTRVVSVLLAARLVWEITVFAAIIWTVWNTINLGWQLYKGPPARWLRYPHLDRWLKPRNLALTGLVPLLLGGLMLSWSPLIAQVTDYRLERDFQHSRSDLVVICDRVLAEGTDSNAIQNDAALGVFESVDVRYQENTVYFDLGDDLREYGFACVAEGDTLPARTAVYEYTPIDARFYHFSEIENRLTPQPETPTPDATPDKE